jgi:hypothetical protein
LAENAADLKERQAADNDAHPPNRACHGYFLRADWIASLPAAIAREAAVEEADASAAQP